MISHKIVEPVHESLEYGLNEVDICRLEFDLAAVSNMTDDIYLVSGLTQM